MGAVEKLEHLRKISVAYSSTTSPRNRELLPAVATKTTLEHLEVHGQVEVQDAGWQALLGLSESSSSGLSCLLEDYHKSRSCPGTSNDSTAPLHASQHSSTSLPGTGPFPEFRVPVEGLRVPMCSTLTRLVLSGIHQQDMAAVSSVLMQLTKLQDLSICRDSPVCDLTDCAFLSTLHVLEKLQMDVVMIVKEFLDFGRLLGTLTKLTGLSVGIPRMPRRAVDTFSGCLSSLVNLQEFRARVSAHSENGSRLVSPTSSVHLLRSLWAHVSGLKIPVLDLRHQ